MSDDERERLARLEERMGHVEKGMSEMRADVKSILAALNEGKGRWAMLLVLCGASGGVGALLSKLLPLVK